MRVRWRWPRFRLWMRIAAMMLLAVVVIQALDALVLYLIFPRVVRIYSGRWLIQTVEQAVAAVYGADAAARHAVSAQFGADNHLSIRWRPERDAVALRTPSLIRPFLERARATLESDLKGKARRVAIRGLIGPSGTELRVDVRYQPPDFANQLPLNALNPEDKDIPVLGPFELAIQGLDGSWLLIGQEETLSLKSRLQAWFIMLFGTAALVFSLSAVTAKKTLRPLDRLVRAARDFGRTRKAVPIDPAGLGEFKVIAQAMNEMQERIKRFVDERTQMLAAMSHDLRTGLTGLRLDAEEMPEGDARDRLTAGVEEMDRMISATLAFAGDELKGEPVRMIDLAALLISLCDPFPTGATPPAIAGRITFPFCASRWR